MGIVARSLLSSAHLIEFLTSLALKQCMSYGVLLHEVYTAYFRYNEIKNDDNFAQLRI